MRDQPETSSSLVDNLLLKTLDVTTRESLAPHMERMPLKVRDSVYHLGSRISHVYFPTEGVISMVAQIKGPTDSMIEVATVGNEGMAGLPLFLGADSTPGHAFTQVPGEALRMTAAAFLGATRQSAQFSKLLHRYTQALLVQISQSTRLQPCPFST